MVIELIPGQFYDLEIVIPGVWNAPRVATMRYLSQTDDEYIFDLRPEAGTQELKKEHVVQYQYAKEQKPKLPRKK